nr:hypothetical protein [uncultured Lachnoclostridium sp.]
MLNTLNPNANIWITYSYIILLFGLIGSLLHFIYHKKSYFMFAVLYGIVFCFMFYFLHIMGDAGVFFPFIISFLLLGASFNMYALFPYVIFLFIDDKFSDIKKINFYKGVVLFLSLICVIVLHFYLFLYKVPPSPVTQHQYSANIDISNCSMVWVSANGKRYHCNPNCSNMTDPDEVPLSEADGMGYTPCKKCY